MQTQGPPRLPTSPQQWRCHLGFHITTATMFLGSFNLIIKAMFFCIKRDNLLESVKSGNKSNVSTDNKYFAFLSIFSCWDFLYIIPGNPGIPDDLTIPGFLLFCTLLITLAMQYGIHIENPNMLLPLVYSQSTEIVLDLISIWKLQHHLPYIQLAYYQFLCPVFWKGYFIFVIWRCYNYLMFLEQALTEPIIHEEPNIYLTQYNIGPNTHYTISQRSPSPPSYDNVVDEDLPPTPYNSILE